MMDQNPRDRESGGRHARPGRGSYQDFGTRDGRRPHRHHRDDGGDGDDPAPTGSGVARVDASNAGARKKTGKKMPLWQELPLLLIVGFCVAVLVRTFLVQAFYIPSGSMEHTLDIEDRVLVNKVVYDVRPPERGEVVVFRGTDGWAPEHQGAQPTTFVGKIGRTVADLVGMGQPDEKDFIKRVIGLPGDTVACCDADGDVTVNGYSLSEPYVTDNSQIDAPPSATSCTSRRFGPVTVPPGHMFVLGDHRAVSQDSRCVGTVPIDNVIGRAFFLVWPSSRWTGLSVPPTFENVPRPVAARGGDGLAPRERPGPVVPALVLGAPIFASLAVPARSRRPRQPRRRTLPP